MKTLYLTRHAKSSWEDLSLNDHDRPLNKRGNKDAPMMGEKLRSMEITPPVLWSSTALRAKLTAQEFAKKLGIPLSSIRFLKEIYDADIDDLIHLIQQAGRQDDALMLFGHNPEFTWLANKLAGTQIDNLPTAGIVSVHFPVDSWEEVGTVKGTLGFFIYPKLFKK